MWVKTDGRQTTTKLELSDYLINTTPGTLVELIAAISGIYYIRHRPKDKIGKQFVWFLCITLGVEIIGMYAPIAYYSKYKIFGFVKDTVFYSNEWLYNIYIIFSYSFYTYFFSSHIDSKRIKKTLHGLIVFYLITAPIYLMFSDVFFVNMSRFSVLFGTFMILFSIFTFCYELLQSDRLLSLKTYLPFYVVIGLLVHTLTNTPTDLLMSYFNLDTGNEFFVYARAKLLMYSNIFMYLTYSLGFIVCSKTNKSY